MSVHELARDTISPFLFPDTVVLAPSSPVQVRFPQKWLTCATQKLTSP